MKQIKTVDKIRKGRKQCNIDKKKSVIYFCSRKYS